MEAWWATCRGRSEIKRTSQWRSSYCVGPYEVRRVATYENDPRTAVHEFDHSKKRIERLHHAEDVTIDLQLAAWMRSARAEHPATRTPNPNDSTHHRANGWPGAVTERRRCPIGMSVNHVPTRMQPGTRVPTRRTHRRVTSRGANDAASTPGSKATGAEAFATPSCSACGQATAT